MARIASKNYPEQGSGFASFPKARIRLSLKEDGSGLLPRPQVVIEEEDRWERRGKVINFSALLLESAGVSQQLSEKLHRFRALPELCQ